MVLSAEPGWLPKRMEIAGMRRNIEYRPVGFFYNSDGRYGNLLHIDRKPRTTATGKKRRTITLAFATTFFRFYQAPAIIARTTGNACTEQDIKGQYESDPFHRLQRYSKNKERFIFSFCTCIPVDFAEVKRLLFSLENLFVLSLKQNSV